MQHPGDAEAGLAGFDANSDVRSLSEIEDGQIIHCGSETCMQILDATHSKSQIDQILIDARPDLAAPWEIMKHDGHLYICGWVASHLTQKQLNGRSITLYSDPNSLEFIVPPVLVTLRVDQFILVNDIRRSSRGYLRSPFARARIESRIRTLELSGIHLDKYAWESKH